MSCSHQRQRASAPGCEINDFDRLAERLDANLKYMGLRWKITDVGIFVGHATDVATLS